MSAHTPGPWAFYGDNNYGGTVEIGPKLTVSIDRADRFTSELVISREEMEANGRLIAAAPELLAACHALLAAEPLLGELCDGACKPGINHHVSGCAVGLALTAIAKAEGGR